MPPFVIMLFDPYCLWTDIIVDYLCVDQHFYLATLYPMKCPLMTLLSWVSRNMLGHKYANLRAQSTQGFCFPTGSPLSGRVLRDQVKGLKNRLYRRDQSETVTQSSHVSALHLCLVFVLVLLGVHFFIGLYFDHFLLQTIKGYILNIFNSPYFCCKYPKTQKRSTYLVFYSYQLIEQR